MSTDSPNVPVPILIFDGDCGFCTSSARWGQARFGLGHVEPWQAIDLDAYGLTPRQCSQAVQWVGVDGDVHAGAAAVSEVLKQADGAIGMVGTVIGLPGVAWLSEAAYRVVARYRYRLPGATQACRR